MRRLLLIVAVVLTALLLQTTVFSQIELLGAHPELMYLIAAVWALYEGPNPGMAVGFAAGMTQDFFLDQPKGITALVLTLIGWGIGYLRQFVTSPSPLVPVGIVAAATFAGQLLYGVVSLLVGQLEVSIAYLLRVAVLTAIYNAVLTPLVVPLLRRAAVSTRTRTVGRWAL